MALYESLASAYDALFPQPETATAYLSGLRPGGGQRSGGDLRPEGAPPPRVLDLGSATGSQLLALARLGWAGVGLEPCLPMLVQARKKATAAGLEGALAFEEGGMEDAALRFPKASFDLVLCLGNTLPHLRDRAGLRAFARDARGLLKPGGSLVLQLLNYRPVLEALAATPVFRLPEIEAPGIRFSRRYEETAEGNLRFLTELKLGNDAPLGDETLLSPFLPADLEAALAEAGFTTAERLPSWKGGAFREENDPYLILRAAPATD